MTDNFPPLDTLEEAVAWAEETVRLMTENIMNIPPSRDPAFHRTHRLIAARLAHSYSERERRDREGLMTPAGVPR